MIRIRSAIAIAGLLLVLVVVNMSIYGKEKLRANGEVIYLELAPVDPRSLMQGDYMALRFSLSGQIRTAVRQRYERHADERQRHDGKAIVTVSARGIARFERLANGQSLAPEERGIRYRWRQGDVRVATDAFYFQEGTAAHYDSAGFGRFRLGKDGELLLTGLAGDDLTRLGLEASSAPL